MWCSIEILSNRIIGDDSEKFKTIHNVKLLLTCVINEYVFSQHIKHTKQTTSRVGFKTSA